MFRRTLAAAMALLIVAGYAPALPFADDLPGFGVTAYAATDTYSALIPTNSDTDLTAKQVSFNGYKWYIIADNSTSATEGTVTLLAADTSFGTSAFDSTAPYSHDYSTSAVKAQLDALTAEGGSFAGAANAIQDTEYGKLYLLSTQEAQALPRKLLNPGFTTMMGGWWLRSPGLDVSHAACVFGEHELVYARGRNVGKEFGVRPALQLNLSSVIFSSQSKSFDLKSSHTHSFNYNANGATITASCTTDDCDLTNSPVLTIAAPQPAAGATALNFDGTAKAATLDGLDAFNTATGQNISAADIIYSGTLSDGTAYPASSTAPTNAGDYTASVTVEGATASVSYSIAKAEPTVTAPTGLTATYGQTLANVTLPTSADGTWTWADDTQSVGNAGSNNFIATYTPNDTINYNTKDNVQVTVTVNQAEPTVTAPTAISGLEYTSFAQALVTAGSTADGTMLYSLDGTNYNADVPTGINAGSYTVYWKVQGDANHLDKSPVSISGITIASIDPTVGAPTAIEGLVYDGTAHALVTAGTTDGGTLMYKLDDGNYSTDIPTATDARDYTVYYYVEGDDNYDTTQPVQLNVSIARATQNAPVLAYTDETVAGLIDGTITGLTTEMEMSTTGAENDYAPVTTDTLTGLAPGTYYIRYAEKANYLPSDPTVITINAGRMITITFVTYGGTRIEPITGAYNTPVEAPADPVKKGFTFTGWDQAIPAVIPAEDMTIAAQWRINSYTISFDTRGGTKVPSITQDYGTEVSAPADPTKTGYTFAGWEPAVPDTMPAEDMTVKAKWEEYAVPAPLPDDDDIPEHPVAPTPTPSAPAYYTPSTPSSYVEPATNSTPAIVTYPTDNSSSPIDGKNIYAKYDGKRSITLSWDAIDDIKSYTVYLITHGKAKKLTETDGTEYTYKNAKPGKTYKFRVKYPTADGLSKASESYNITVAAYAKKPVVTATAKNGKIILKWNKVPGATEYAVYRVNSKGKLTKAGSTKKTQMVISQRPTDKGYAVKALVNGKWTTVTKADIAVVSE